MHLEIRTTTNGRKHHIIIEKVPKLASFPVTFVFRHWNDEHKQGWLWPCSSGRNLRPGCGDGWWFDLAGFGRNLLFVNCDLTAQSCNFLLYIHWPSIFVFYHQTHMSEILSLMANLRFSDEDINSMETLYFVEDHQVEGTYKWILGRVLAPLVVDHVMLLRVLKSSEEGLMVVRHMQPMVTVGDRGKGIGVNPSKVTCSKRTHNQKDVDGLL
ncbi:hypothetical protein V6N12_048897 [Hibiscus sabdariffa]|uniref:Uncharacterized protein n=1 Tax=Hibiscus sabdariffa TaxID=183260 RepID=A0ABR2EIL4_9ROSI